MAMFTMYREGPHRHLVAAQHLSAGTPILRITGVQQHTPTRYSVQAGINSHIAPPESAADLELEAAYPWCFLNHACAPTARIQVLEVIAVRKYSSGVS